MRRGFTIVLVKQFQVVPPLTMDTAVFIKEEFIAPANVGVDFRVKVPVLPSDVSFQNVEFLEVGTDAIDLGGVFAHDQPSMHSHTSEQGADRWFELNGDGTWNDHQYLVLDKDEYYVMNNGQRDRSKFPYVGKGNFSWDVPMKWRVSKSGEEHSLAIPEFQERFIEDGTTTIYKFGHSRSRSPQLN